MKPKIRVSGKPYQLFTNPFNSKKENTWKSNYFLDSNGYVQPKDLEKDVFHLKALEG